MNDRSRGRSRKRPWLAVLLTLLLPGLGHLYVREWLRSLAWFLTYVLARRLLLPAEVLPESFSWDAFVEAAEATSPWASLAVLLIAFLCTVEVYILVSRYNARAGGQRGTETTTCPDCGKELDTDLDFCHWCTTRLDEPEQ